MSESKAFDRIQVPAFNGEEASYYSWKRKAKAFFTTQGLGETLKESEATSTDQTKRQAKLYSLLILAVSEKDELLIAEFEDTPNAGYAAWRAIVEHYEDTGVYRTGELRDQLEEKQRPDETGVQYLLRLVSVRKQLKDVNVDITDDHIMHNVVRGLRKEYDVLTHGLNLSSGQYKLADLKKLLVECGRRVEDREEAARKENQDAAAFAAVVAENADLKARLAKASEQKHRRDDNKTGGQFGGKCWECGERGHRRSDCPKLDKEAKGSAHTAHAGKPDLGLCAVAGQSQGDAVASAAVRVRAATLGPDATDRRRWVVDSGASEPITAYKTDFVRYEPLPQPRHIGGIDCSAVGQGDVREWLTDDQGEPIRAVIRNVLYAPGLLARTDGSIGRLYSTSAATAQGHRFTLEDGACRLDVHGAVSIPLVQEHGLVWLPTIPPPNGKVLHAAPAKVTNQLWHRRLGHMGAETLRRTAAGNVVGMTFSPGSGLPHCDVCATWKSRVQDVPRNGERRDPGQPMHTVGFDVYGPMRTRGLYGEQYAAVGVCFSTGAVMCDLIRSKDQATQSAQGIFNRASSLGHTVRIIRTDHDAIFTGQPFTTMCAAHGVHRESAAPYSQFQNGRVERVLQTLGNTARCMLADSGLPDRFWGLALRMAVHIRNRTYTKGTDGIPWQLLTGQRPDLSSLRVFGSRCFVHIDKSRRWKSSPRAWQGVFVGYPASSPGWLVWNPKSSRLFVSRNVTFDEPHTVEGEGQPEVDIDSVTPDNDMEEDTPAGEPEAPEEGENTTTEEPETTQEEEEPSAEEPEDDGPTEPDNQRRSQRQRRPQQWREQDKAPRTRLTPGRQQKFGSLRQLSAAPATAEGKEEPEPRTYKEAVSGPNAALWRASMDEEFDSLVKNGTWELVPRPGNRNIIGGMWAFKHKKDGKGVVIRYKSRYVARGDQQKAGADFNDVFAPVVDRVSLRAVLALAARNDWEIEQMDVKTAYLYATLDTETYMRQPQGYEVKGEDGQELVCLLRRAIYGLKQSGRQWNELLTAWLGSVGFNQSRVDPGIYTYKGDARGIYVLAIYVDDTILAGPDGPFIASFKASFKERFQIDDLGHAAWVLGMTISRNRAERILELGQQQYILDVLERHGMAECRPVCTPVAMGTVAGESEEMDDQGRAEYQSAVGGLMYAATNTRPDISMAVSRLTRHMSKPQAEHWEQAKRVMRYLKGTYSHTLVLGGGANKEVEVYVDSSFADEEGRRSRTGYVVRLGHSTVAWGSKLQHTVALSTVEAEYMALAVGVQEAVFMRQLMEDLGHKQQEATTIHEDNQGCIALANNNMTSTRTKHIDTRYHFTRERIQAGEVAVAYCPTKDMLADGLTKPLTGPRHSELTSKIMNHAAKI